MGYSFKIDELLGLDSAANLTNPLDSAHYETAIAEDGNQFSRYTSQAKTLPSWDKGAELFDKTGTGRNAILNEMRGTLDIHDELSSSLKDTLADIGEGRGATRVGRQLQRGAKDIERKAQKLYTVADNLVEKHGKAIAAATSDYGEAKAALMSRFAAADEKLRKVALGKAEFGYTVVNEASRKTALESLKTMRDNAIDRLDKVYGDLKAKHATSVDELKYLIEDVESASGVKKAASAALEQGLKSEAQSLEKGAAQEVAGGHYGGRGAAIGAVVGGAVGYLGTSDPESKGTNAAIGAGIGGIAGYVIGAMQKAKTQLAAVFTPAMAAEKGLLTQASKVGHMFRG